MVRIIKQKWTCKNLKIKVVPFHNDSMTQAGRFQAIVFRADSISRKHITVAPIYVKAFDVTIDIYALFYKDKIRTTKRKKTVVDILTFTGEYAAVFGHHLLMEAKLQIVDHRKINLVPTKVKVNGIPLPSGPVRSLLSKVNPLLDATCARCFTSSASCGGRLS
jgi:hydroxypyruvate isomerase